jgi:hypothetical protein
MPFTVYSQINPPSSAVSVYSPEGETCTEVYRYYLKSKKQRAILAIGDKTGCGYWGKELPGSWETGVFRTGVKAHYRIDPIPVWEELPEYPY